jgi:pSer/pThr/pTyr-binding forkhead associated (FHA) protein
VPCCADIVLEHPSSSRLHAVLQFNGETKAAFLYDTNSAHGTFVNRRRIKAGVHVPIRCSSEEGTHSSRGT